MINVQNISFQYGSRNVLKDIHFQVQDQEILGILGPNASGKTTLIKNLANLLSPQIGKIELQGKDLNSYQKKGLARLLAFVPQEEEIFLDFTVEQIVLMGRAPHLGFWGFESPEDRLKARSAMEATDIWKLRESSLMELSGGERQRVVLARAMTQEAPLILLDEPTSHLDVHYQLQILDLCSSLNKEHKTTFIITLHDLNLASLYCHRLLLLREGQIFALGKPEDVINQKNIQSVFQTEALIGQYPETKLPYFLPRRQMDVQR